jgi:pimeloyl-ACP methyl ester carboxylesterase
MHTEADGCLELMKHLDIGGHIVGHSIGAAVALQLALGNPLPHITSSSKLYRYPSKFSTANGTNDTGV